MNWQSLNKQLVSLCAVGILFIGSLYYLVAVAFDNEGTLEARQATRGLYDDLY